MKDTINIAIDFDLEKGEAAIQLHTIIKGESKHTGDIMVTEAEKSFPQFWQKIGKIISEHVGDNKEYDHFGS